MLLFLDSETTGLPLNWNAPITDLKNWPRVVQLAYLLYDAKGVLVNSGSHIIRPEGFTIPAQSAKIHRITQARALAEGQPLAEVLHAFEQQAAQATTLIAHNISFDEKVVGAELLRAGRQNLFEGKRKFCTMRQTADYCKLPGTRGYKWPTLAELHQKIFKQGFAESHDAAVDIDATAKCYWELKRLKVI